MKKITQNVTLNEYNNEVVVEGYEKAVEKVGLWESEKVIFNKYLKSGMKILDIGCGAGRTTFNLYKSGYKNIIGFDLSAAMISACCRRVMDEKLDIQFICGNACEMNFADNVYDACIFSFNGLMTIPKRENRAKVFTQVFRVLKENGVFIFTTHDIQNETFRKYWNDEKVLWENGTQDKRLYEYGDMIFIDKNSGGSVEGFVHIPTYEEIYEEVERAGFKIVEQTVRSKLCEENQNTLAQSADCIFWVVRKGC